MMSLGAAAGLIAAMRDRRVWVRVVCGINIVLLLLFTVMFYGLARLPAAPKFTDLEIAPDFTLIDHTGQPLTLSEARAAGPVLLVFYRGHW